MEVENKENLECEKEEVKDKSEDWKEKDKEEME